MTQNRPEAAGCLAALLRAGVFAVTAEMTPPLTADPEIAVAEAFPFKGLADAVNVTDGAGARAHASSLAVARLLLDAGIEPVLQLNCRDRNALALERELLGAAALGIVNLLCLSGDPIERGDEPAATAVFDLDSAGLAALAARLRDVGALPSGRRIATPPRYLIGVADNPVDPPAGWRPASLLAKLDAGAGFVQTQFCFDLAVARRYVAALGDHGVLDRASILIGIGPLASAQQARWMVDNLPGTIIPDALLRRLDGAAEPQEEGIAICVELLQALREAPGVAGAHLMGPRSEAASAEAIARSGVLSVRGAV